MGRDPLVSIVMPVYNCREFIGEALKGIFDQTFTDFELLVIDDGSTDGTDELLLSVADPRMQILRRPHRGLEVQLNEGLRLARGRWIARFDGDDVSHPERLAQQTAYVLKHPDVGLLGTSYSTIDRNGNPIGDRRFPVTDAEIRTLFPLFCPISHGTAFYLRSLVLDVGGYIEGTAPNEDYHLWLRMIDRTTVANLPERLVRVRKHAASVTSMLHDTARSQRLGFAEEYLARKLNESASDHSAVVDLLVSKALCQYYYGSVDTARSMLLPLVRYRWRDLRFWRYLLPSFLGETLFAAIRKNGIARAVTKIFRMFPNAHRYYHP